MDIILIEDFPALGYVGDKVTVKRGYARNYLIPRGVGIEANSRNAKVLTHQLQMVGARRQKRKAEAEVLAAKMAKEELSFQVRVSEGGRSFGSVTTKEIEAVLKEKGYTVDRKQIKLVDQLKSVGTHSVQVKLHSEVIVTIPVTLNSDLTAAAGEKTEGEVDASAKGARKGRKSPAKKAETAETEE